MQDNIVPFPESLCSKDNASRLYNGSIKQLDKLQTEVANASIDLENLINIRIEKTPSDLDGYDWFFAILFGILGAFLTTREKVKEFCNQIHQDASTKNPQELIGKLLKHNGDSIDQIDGNFINRDGQMADIKFHRLLWGHDPISLGKDNPFYLLIQQNGLLKGVVKVFTHLVADTFSTQGLPIPGHSFFDKQSDGKTTNLLKDISMKLANNDRQKAGETFSHMFTIRAQDVAGQGLVWVASLAYFRAREIEDITRKHQYRIVSYATNFFTHAAVGAWRQGGVPYISWPALTALVRETAGLFIDSYKEIKQLERITESINSENIELEKQVFLTGADLKTYENSNDYVGELKRQDKIFENLVSFFEER